MTDGIIDTDYITDPYERRRLGLPYMPHDIQSRLIRERYRQPIEREGVILHPTVTAAKAIGRSTNYLLLPSQKYAGLDCLITMDNGWQFYRLTRHKGDRRYLVYWNLESIRDSINDR